MHLHSMSIVTTVERLAVKSPRNTARVPTVTSASTTSRLVSPRMALRNVLRRQWAVQRIVSQLAASRSQSGAEGRSSGTVVAVTASPLHCCSVVP